MGDLSIKPVDITFNALVQQMQKLYAGEYKVRPDAEVLPEYQLAQFIKYGNIVIPDDEFPNNVFDSDALCHDFEAWKASARVRVMIRKNHVENAETFQQMCSDILSRHNYDKKVATWFMILHCLIVDKYRFEEQFGFWPDPENAWVRTYLETGGTADTGE